MPVLTNLRSSVAMASITAANSIYALAILNLYPVPQILQGYSADAAFDTEAGAERGAAAGARGPREYRVGGRPFELRRHTIDLNPRCSHHALTLPRHLRRNPPPLLRSYGGQAKKARKVCCLPGLRFVLCLG